MTFLTDHCDVPGACCARTCAKAPGCRFAKCKGEGPKSEAHGCTGHLAKAKCSDYVTQAEEEPPPWAKSLGWCQECSEDGIQRTEQLYVPYRGRWICERCGMAVVNPQRAEEIKRIAQTITVEDIYGRRTA